MVFSIKSANRIGIIRKQYYINSAFVKIQQRSLLIVMQKIMLSGKIHNARLTACMLDYEGSLEIDPVLLNEAGILPYEKILVVNRNNGKRLETYAIPGEPGSKVFCLNGPAAHCGSVGDVITIMAFSVCSETEAAVIAPTVIVLDEKNEIIMRKGRARH